MISSAKEEERFAAGKERKRVYVRPPAGRAAFGVLSSLRGKAEKHASIKKAVSGVGTAFFDALGTEKKRSRGKGFDALRSLAEERAGSARLMRGDGKNVRVRRGSMSEDLGGGEGGFSPLDARER